MVIACQASSHLRHGRGRRQPPFIGNRMGACVTIHAIDNHEILIICDNDARNIRTDCTRTARGNRHRRRRLADGNDRCHRGGDFGHRTASQAGWMPGIKRSGKGSTGCLLPALQIVSLSRHHVTGSIRSCPAAKARAFSTTFSPIAVRLSTVADPRCGKRTVLRAARMAGLISGSP